MITHIKGKSSQFTQVLNIQIVWSYVFLLCRLLLCNEYVKLSNLLHNTKPAYIDHSEGRKKCSMYAGAIQIL